MKKWIAEYILLGVLSVLFMFTAVTYFKEDNLQKQISKKVLRFHVLANSDSESDQSLKLKVRDEVGTYMQQLLNEQDVETLDVEACEMVVAEHLDEIKKTAEAVIEKEGYSYTVQAEIAETDFPMKTYGEYTFPAGKYEALRLKIGEGAGHNWWCVMYPNMCFVDGMYEIVDEKAEDSLRRVLSEEEYETVLECGNYQVEFKYLTFLNDLTNKD